MQANVSDDDLNRMIASVKGKNITQLIADGSKKLGATGPAPSGGAAKGAPKAAEKPKEEKKPAKEEKKKPEPKKEDSDDDMGLGGGLFD